MTRERFISIIGCAAGTMFLIMSCEKGFDEINTDPNMVTNVPGDYLLPGAIMSISNAENSYMESFAYASDWVQHSACGIWTDPGRYYFEKPRVYMWDLLYSGPLMDLAVMNAKAIMDGNDGLRAASNIMYCYAFSLLTDTYGPIPYSKALSAESGENKPSYDQEEDVIHAIIDSLALANELLKNLSSVDIEKGYDILFDGDAEGWQKFGNALKMRLLMRISIKEESFAAPLINDLVNNPDDNPLPGSTLDNVYFYYPGDAPLTYHPLYDILSEDASDGGYRISETLVDLMTATSDPRLPYYAHPNEDGIYKGLKNGTQEGSAQIDQYSRINSAFGQKDRPGIFMSYSEVAFMLAEAAERSIISGDPEAYYNDAIRASFNDIGLSVMAYNTFIARPEVSYTGLERIYIQKWVSLFGRGMEAWAEQRRTGTPDLSPAVSALVNSIPSRFLYPITEEQSNNIELQKAIETLSDGDALTSKIWWMTE